MLPGVCVGGFSHVESPARALAHLFTPPVFPPLSWDPLFDVCWWFQLDIPIGTMMELPRACQTADEIVATDSVEFMSFGTNVRLNCKENLALAYRVVNLRWRLITLTGTRWQIPGIFHTPYDVNRR